MPVDDKQQSIPFRYLKSNFFRVVHVDGAFGGVTPRGSIFISMYSERGPLPDVTVQAIEEGGRFGKELIEQRQVQPGVVRELEVGLVMDLQTAKSLFKWFKERIDVLEAAAKTREMKADKEVKMTQ